MTMVDVTNLIKNVLPWTAFFVLAYGAFLFLGRYIGQENFRKALIGLAHKNIPITIEEVVDLYLGSYEKSKANFSASDLRRLESSYLWALAALIRESETTTPVTHETLRRLQSLPDLIRRYEWKH